MKTRPPAATRGIQCGELPREELKVDLYWHCTVILTYCNTLLKVLGSVWLLLFSVVTITQKLLDKTLHHCNGAEQEEMT